MNNSEAAFEGFREVWTPVALSTEVGAKPLARCIAGTEVVLFRGAGGAVSALLDRCPHRSVKLSLGAVVEGCLRCPFHGWQFDGAGACVKVPWNPDAKRAQLSATALPTLERGGFVWLFTSTNTPPRSEPSLPSELLRDDVRLSGESFVWGAHWTRAVENMVDDSHLPFVHPRSIGRGMLTTDSSRLEVELEELAWGLRWRVAVDGRRAEWEAELHFPNVSLLRIPVPGRLLGICFAAVPIGPRQVRVLQLGYRDFLRFELLDPVFRWINRSVLREDQPVVESAPEEAGALEERSVPTDVVGLRFRKRVRTELTAP